MEIKSNRHFDQVINSFEARSEILLTDKQKRILAHELQAFASNVLSTHWRYMHDSFDKARDEFRREL